MVKVYYFKIFYTFLYTNLFNVIKTVILLGIILSFLYNMFLPPYINYYYFVETTKDSYFNYAITLYPTGNSSNLNLTQLNALTNEVVNKLARKISKNYILEDEYVRRIEFQCGEHSYTYDITLLYADKPDDVKMVYPDINLLKLKELYNKGVDGILIIGKLIVKNELENEFSSCHIVKAVIFYDNSHKYNYTLYIDRSRGTWESPYIHVVLFIPRITFSPALPSGMYIRTNLDEESLNNTLNEFIKSCSNLVFFNVQSKESIIAYDERTIMTQAYKWLSIISIIALVVSILISFRDGSSYINSGRELIGILRLYGATRRTILFIILMTGSIISVSVFILTYLFSFLFYTYFMNANLPPLTYLLYKANYLPLMSALSLMLSMIISLLYKIRRISLEEYVVGV